VDLQDVEPRILVRRRELDLPEINCWNKYDFTDLRNPTIKRTVNLGYDLSILPGRRRAESRMSIRLVAMIT
jgi:hypothetical protein